MNKSRKSELDNKNNNVINLNYTKESEEKIMNEEEKSMIQYKEPKGPFQWLKTQFKKLKEIFGPKPEVKKGINQGPGLTPEQLEVAEGGFPDRSVLDYDELEAKKNSLQELEEPKSWDLTGEEHKIVEEGYEKIRATNSQATQGEQDLEPDELSQEDLDKVNPYQPGITPRYDFPKKKIDENDKFVGR